MRSKNKCMGIRDKATLLDIQGLKCYIPTIDGIVKAVDGVDVSINRGEAFGIAGESGCGKSMLALAIMGLIPAFQKRDIQGRVLFKGKDLLQCTESEMNTIRGNKISMIFQEPMTSLNPTLSIGTQLTEILLKHEKISKKEANSRATELMKIVNISSGRKMLSQYPHQFSGGMRQRVMIAMALACQPELLIADEPTTALDVTIQAQIISLISDLQKNIGTSTILITHNLGLIAEFATRIMVMYLGRAVEIGGVYDLFDNPLHPYTMGLLNAVPKLGRRSKIGKVRLEEIKGTVPSPMNAPKGCTFYMRCNYAKPICSKKEPGLEEISAARYVRCWRHNEI